MFLETVSLDEQLKTNLLFIEYFQDFLKWTKFWSKTSLVVILKHLF